MQSYDYAIIGAGPGGYVSAIRAAQLGLKTVLIEKEERLGGTCLNIGCIPSKALLESSEWFHAVNHKYPDFGIRAREVKLDLKAMMAKKIEIVHELTDGVSVLMKKNKVTVLRGTGRLTGQREIVIYHPTEQGGIKGGATEISAKTIVIATGSIPIELPFMKFDGERIVSSTEALAFDSVPERLIVVGAGAVGLELGSVWARLGAKVSIVEMLPQIVPFADKQLATMLQRSLTSQGIEFHLNAKVTGAEVKDRKVVLSFEMSDGASKLLEGDKVLVAVGRKPNSAGLGLEKVGVRLGKSGQIPVDDHWQTNVPGVYAIGDLVHGPMLAHKASEEGIAVAEIAAGLPGRLNYDTIPNVVYTSPELAVVGRTEAELKAEGVRFRVGKFYFRGNGRALSLGETDGLVKVVADAETDRLLGVHILGPRASDLVAEAVAVMEFNGTAEDVARMTHAHPTLSEAVKEAALAVDKRQIHG